MSMWCIEGSTEKKKIEKMIASKYPNYISPYQMVSFSNIPYAEALQNGKVINRLLEELAQVENLEEKFQSDEMQDKIQPILFG